MIIQICLGGSSFLLLIQIYELKVLHIGYKTEIISIEIKANLLTTININLKNINLDISEVRIITKKLLN